MECKFCGKELNENETLCPHCEKEQNKPEKTEVEKLIDNMPKLHDEFDSIKKMRARKEKKRRKKIGIIICVLVAVLCAAGVWAGITFFPEFFGIRDGSEDVDLVVSTGVPGERTEVFGTDYTSVIVLDELTAKDAVDSMREELGITGEHTDFALESRRSVGTDTYYRFRQQCFGVDVYDGEIVLVVSKDGTVTAVNGSIVETDGLKDEAKLDMGAASNAISEYTNKLTKDFVITAGAVMTNATKTVYNFEGNTYLAYMANVSGYNDHGMYIAYDAFVDANTGGGIHLRVTSFYEPDTSAEEQIPAEEPLVVNPAKLMSADSSRMELYTVSDKFNWNDETIAGAVELVEKEYLKDGSVSAYIAGTKSAVDEAYAYFADRFDYRGLDGQNGTFRVYVNPSEYLEEKLPPENALFARDVLMFHREDLTQGTPNRNVVMHEYAHGVMDNIYNPDGTYGMTESAAIAEGLADVFGEVAESYFTGSSDWVHESRNFAAPDSAYLVTLPEKTEILSLTDCYRYSTIVSSAMYRMNQKGVGADAIGELLYRTVCFMTRGADFRQWKTATAFAATSMRDSGRLTGGQFNAVISSLSETAIPGDVISSRPVEQLGETVIE